MGQAPPAVRLRAYEMAEKRRLPRQDDSAVEAMAEKYIEFAMREAGNENDTPTSDPSRPRTGGPRSQEARAAASRRMKEMNERKRRERAAATSV